MNAQKAAWIIFVILFGAGAAIYTHEPKTHPEPRVEITEGPTWTDHEIRIVHHLSENTSTVYCPDNNPTDMYGGVEVLTFGLVDLQTAKHICGFGDAAFAPWTTEE